MRPQRKADTPAESRQIAVCRYKAASLLDISPSTFDEWVRRGWMPQGVKIGALRRWDAAELVSYWQNLIERNSSDGEDDGENPLDHLVG